jgi:hypothetical protein
MVETDVRRITKQGNWRCPELKFDTSATRSEGQESETLTKHFYTGIVSGSQGKGKTRGLVTPVYVTREEGHQHRDD